MIYILQHTITHEIMAVFTNKELANRWHEGINYTQLLEKEITQADENDLAANDKP